MKPSWASVKQVWVTKKEIIGQFPNRHGFVRDGHVMRRLDSAGRKLTFARSGMFIPVEMTSGGTAAAFEQTAAPLLKARVEAALVKLVP